MYPLRLNLLNKKKQEKNLHTAQFKFVQSLFQMILIGISIAAMTLLFSQNLLEKYFTNIAQNTVVVSSNYTSATKEITDINNLTKQVLDIQTKYHIVTPTIISLASSTPPGIILTSLNIDYKNKTIKFSGTAETRQNFLDFQEALDKNEDLTNVNSPVSDLTKKENITFNIDAKIK